MAKLALNILVVEDDQDMQNLVKRTLEQLKIAAEIRIYKTGEEALAFVEELVGRAGRGETVIFPSLVILDLHIAGGANGLEILEKIKAVPQLQSVPVIIYSGSGQKEDVLKVYRVGGAIYLQKPAKPEVFMEI